MDWVFKESVGRAGGLLCMWKRKTFVIQDSFVGNGFLGVKGV